MPEDPKPVETPEKTPPNEDKSESVSISKKKIAILAAIPIIMAFYGLMEKGFFDSFLVTPPKFEKRMDGLEKAMQMQIESLQEQSDKQKEVIIKLNTQMEMILKTLDRMEGKIDKSLEGARMGMTRGASPNGDPQ